MTHLKEIYLLQATEILSLRRNLKFAFGGFLLFCTVPNRFSSKKEFPPTPFFEPDFDIQIILKQMK